MAGQAGNFYTLAIGRQTAKGTPQTTPKLKLKLTGGIVVPQPNVIDLPETDSSIQRSRAVKVGQVIAGAIQGQVRSNELPFLAYGALGALATVGTNPYTHTATASNSGAPYFTLYSAYASTVLVDQYVDCRITELELAGGSGEFLTYGSTFLGLTATAGQTDPGAPSPLTDNPLVFPHVTVTKGGSTTDIVERFSLRSTKVAEAIQGDTGMAASEVALGRWGVEGQLTILFESDADWRKWLTGSAGGTTMSPTIFTEALTITASASATNDEVSAVMTAVELRQIGLAPDPSGAPLRYTYAFTAQPQATIANTLSIVTKNTTASY